jgi:hypothetical protein
VLLKTSADASFLDYQWWAMRAVGEIDYKRRLDSKTAQLAIDNNEWSAGARLDLKLPLFRRQVRPYVGYFWEGELKGPPEYVTAKITRPNGDGFTATRLATGASVFRKDPLHFQYTAAGIDFLNIWRLFPESRRFQTDVTKGALQLGWGRRHNIPVGSRINGVDQRAETFTDGGAQAVIDAYFTAQPADFTPGVDFVAIDEGRDHTRYQAELNLQPRLIVGDKTWKFGVEFRARHYPKVDDSKDDSVKNSLRIKLGITLPVTERLELVPAFERQLANIHRVGSGRYRHDKFEMTFKLPFVARAGWGWLVW